MPCSPARARDLLKKGRAVVARLFPFTIRLKDRVGGATQPLALLIDPGSKKSGLALARLEKTAEGETRHPLFLAELEHRGLAIREALTQRAAYRGRRRGNLRHRAPRFLHRTKPSGWLPPSLRHRVLSTMSRAKLLSRLCPLTEIWTELARFDMQALENPAIEGAEYQRGTLFGYEVREYLLAKWRRACAYCGKEGVPLQVEHIQCRARGGSSRLSNLTLACEPCNQKKGKQPVEIFLKKKPAVLAKILAQAKTPLRDAAAVNSTRHALVQALKETGLLVRTASGGRTKYNRQRLGLPKTHALDALCVGEVLGVGEWRLPTLEIKCTGRGAYQRTRVDKYGFPRGYLMRQKRVQGFQTGDMVRAFVPSGKKAGTYTGRVAVRASGSFNLQTALGTVQGISHRHCLLLQRADGYRYSFSSISSKKAALLPSVNEGVTSRSAPETP